MPRSISGQQPNCHAELFCAVHPLPQSDPSSLSAAQARGLSVPPPHRLWSAAARSLRRKAQALSGNQPNCPLKIMAGCERPTRL